MAEIIKCEKCGKTFDVTHGMNAAIKHRNKEKHSRFIPIQTGK